MIQNEQNINHRLGQTTGLNRHNVDLNTTRYVDISRYSIYQYNMNLYKNQHIMLHRIIDILLQLLLLGNLAKWNVCTEVKHEQQPTKQQRSNKCFLSPTMVSYLQDAHACMKCNLQSSQCIDDSIKACNVIIIRMCACSLTH